MKKIGFTCSCFDLFHAGHIMMLKESKSICDHLIVGLQTDPTIDRPEKELLDILHSYPINIRIVGDEYKDKEFTGKELSHIEMYYNSRNHSFSTTELRMRVIEKYKLEKKK